MGTEQSSCTAVICWWWWDESRGGSRQLGLLLLRWAQAPAALPVARRIPKVSGRISWFLLPVPARELFWKEYYVYSCALIAELRILSGYYSVLLEVQVTHSCGFLLLEYYCLLQVGSRTHLQVVPVADTGRFDALRIPSSPSGSLKSG